MPVAGAKDKTSGGEGWRSCPSASRLAPMAVLRQTTQRSGRFSFLCILHHPHPPVYTERPLLPFASHTARSKSTQRTSISRRVQNDVSAWLVNADADYANRLTSPDVFQLRHLTSKRSLSAYRYMHTAVPVWTRSSPHLSRSGLFHDSIYRPALRARSPKNGTRGLTRILSNRYALVLVVTS